MVLHSVILCTILAFSLANTEQCVSSAGSSIDLSLHSMKSASGHWIISVETRRRTIEEDPREISANIRHETKMCGKKEIEHLIAVVLVYPSLHDTSMPGAIEPSTIRTTSTTTTATTPTTTTTTTTSTTTPKSCPHSGEPARSTWWRPGRPDGNAAHKCARADNTGLLGNNNCEYTSNFICEFSL